MARTPSVQTVAGAIVLEEAWKSSGPTFLDLFSDLPFNRKANDIIADFVRKKIGQVVDDPKRPRG